MFDWDYFPLTKLGRGRWARSFIARPDGSWNFYPRGLGEPGYRVDQIGRDLLTRASFTVRTPFEWLLIAGAAFGLADGGSLKIPGDGSFKYALVALYLASVAYFVVKGRTMLRDALDLLARNPQVVTPLSAAERLHRNIDEWRATPRIAKICTLFLAVSFCQGCLMESIKLISAMGFLSHFDAIINAALSAGSALYLVRLVSLTRAARLAVTPATVLS